MRPRGDWSKYSFSCWKTEDDLFSCRVECFWQGDLDLGLIRKITQLFIHSFKDDLSITTDFLIFVLLHLSIEDTFLGLLSISFSLIFEDFTLICDLSEFSKDCKVKKTQSHESIQK